MRRELRFGARGLTLVAALALVACGDDAGNGGDGDGSGADAGADASSATVTIGTGFRDYEPVDDGAMLEFVYGIQGGFHLWGAFHAEGLADGDAAIDFELFHNGELVGSAYYTDTLTADDSGATEYSGVSVAVTTTFQDRLIIPEEILGEDDRLGNDPNADFDQGAVTMTVRVEDSAGTVVTDELDVIARCCSL